MLNLPRFPSLGWFRMLAQQSNSDEDFLQLARWTNARVGFCIEGEPPIVLTFIDGRIVSVEEGLDLRGVDYSLEGPREGWNILFRDRGNLALATNQLFGKIRIKGNLVLAAGDNWTLANLCRRFRNISQGGSAP